MTPPIDALLPRRLYPEDPPRLWDGAIGTELIARGLDLDRDPPESFTLHRPDDLRDLHARYVAAGAEIVQTNTFGGSRPRLEAGGLEASLAAVNRDAVRLAREAGARLVVGSLGPTGIEPYTPGAAARIEAAYEEQIEHLAAAGCDALHFETMYHPVEAKAALVAARRAAPRLPALVSFTVALGDHGYQTPLGVPLAQMAQSILDEGPDAIGLNCSLEARKILGPLRALRERTEIPVLVQPQAGRPSVGCKGDSRGDTPERFAKDCLALLRAGADGLGGCCGAGPDHIAALARALAALEEAEPTP